MNDRFEQISTDLINKTNELHFLKGSLNNLEKVQLAQEAQKHWGWSHAVGVFMDDLRGRATDLEHDIAKLTEEQKELYKKQRQEANDQIARIVILAD